LDLAPKSQIVNDISSESAPLPNRSEKKREGFVTQHGKSTGKESSRNVCARRTSPSGKSAHIAIFQAQDPRERGGNVQPTRHPRIPTIMFDSMQ
jgi:hypothetical protein